MAAWIKQGRGGAGASARGRKKRAGVARSSRAMSTGLVFFAQSPLPQSRLERDLARGFTRRSFRIERFWRALMAGASFDACLVARAGESKSALLASLDCPGAEFYRLVARSVSSNARRRRGRKAGSSRREGGAVFDAAFKTGKKNAMALWGAMRKWGVDFEALDDKGLGFEIAVAGNRLGGEEIAGPAWEMWKKRGGSVSRAPGELGVLEAVAVISHPGAKGELFDALERVWPQECSRESANAALRGAVALARVMDDGRGASKGSRREWLEGVGEYVVRDRSEAARSDHQLSEEIARLGGAAPEGLIDAESREIAKRESALLERELGAAREGAAESSAVKLGRL